MMKYKSARLMSLVDSIYSISMTLMVFDLKMSGQSISGIAELISRFWSMDAQLFHAFISFWLVLFLWLKQHELHHHAPDLDFTSFTIQCISVFFIAMVPFALSLTRKSQSAIDILPIILCFLLVAILYYLDSFIHSRVLLEQQSSPTRSESVGLVVSSRRSLLIFIVLMFLGFLVIFLVPKFLYFYWCLTLLVIVFFSQYQPYKHG